MTRSKYSWSEIVADIAYVCGKNNFNVDLGPNSSWLYTMEQMIDWAEEFDKRHKKTDWDETDYWETMDDFINEKKINKKRRKVKSPV